jgi:hypothetical protein
MSTSLAADAVEAGRPFADVPCDTRGHLGLLYYAAAFQLIYYLRSRASEVESPLAEVLREHPFLESYFMQIRSRLPEDIDWEQSPVWLRERILEWEHGTASVLPLVALREALDLPYAGTLAFLFAGLVEEQVEFSALFASIQKPVTGNRVSLGLFAAGPPRRRNAGRVGLRSSFDRE